MKIGVFIGRFQPVTLAHENVIIKSLQSYDKLIILIGSSEATCSIRNPFDKAMRVRMIESIIGERNPKVEIRCIPDSNYNLNKWIKDVQSTVNRIIEKEENPVVYLIGAFKDAGSYWLNIFPQWKQDTFKPIKLESATTIREKLFRGESWQDLVPFSIRDIIEKWIFDNNGNLSFLWNDLRNEQRFVDNYKKKWEMAPYPPTMVTTDAAVLCKGHILLIKRKLNPGKGLYALPGGHLNQDEYIKDCAVRELKEETKIDMARPILENSIKQVKVFDDPLRDPRGRYITHVHVFDLNIKDLPDIRADDDAKEVMWMPFNEIDKIQNLFFADHYQIIKNILES